MSYLDYIKQELGEYFDAIVKELGYIGNEAAPNTLVIREFVGVNFKGSIVLPVELSVVTNDVEKYLGLLNEFANSHSTISFTSELNHVKQNYATARLDQAFIDAGREVLSIVSLQGTLLITDDIDDIEKILVDGEEIYFDSIQEDYVAIVDSPKKTDEWLHKTTIRGGINKIQISALSKNTLLSRKIKNIKKGINGNVIFKVEVHYISDGEIITYDMKLDSNTFMTSSANLPFATISLTQ